MSDNLDDRPPPATLQELRERMREGAPPDVDPLVDMLCRAQYGPDYRDLVFDPREHGGDKMSNAEIFRMVARREMSPSEAAEQMKREDEEARLRLRPNWMPVALWGIVVALALMLLSACGIRRD